MWTLSTDSLKISFSEMQFVNYLNIAPFLKLICEGENLLDLWIIQTDLWKHPNKRVIIHEADIQVTL